MKRSHNKIYFISGVSGVGKTSTLLHLKKMLPGDQYDIHDLDERGVPDGGGQVWLDGETRHWLEVAKTNATVGKSTIICGFADPDQFEKIYNQETDVPAKIILLHASSETIRKRLYGRYPTPESIKEINRASGVSLDTFVEGCISFAPEFHSVFKKHAFPIVDTDNKTPEEVTREIIKNL